MRGFKLSRRAMLRGLGVAIALPPLEAMFRSLDSSLVGAARADVPTEPRRLVVFHWPGGLPGQVGAGADAAAEFFFPPAEGTSSPLGSTPRALAPLLEGGPYGDFRQDINLVSGLTCNPLHETVCSHGHCTAVFTGHPAWAEENCTELGGGPSVDVVAAERLGGPALPILMPEGTSSSARSYGGDYWRWSQDQRQPSATHRTYALPSEIWADFFHTGQLGDAERALYERRQASILDFVKGDADRLRGRLGGADRRRLEEHLDTIRSIEQSFMGVSGTCEEVAQPADDYAFLRGEPYGDFDRYAEDLIRLGVLAVRCDLSRSLLVSLGPSQVDSGRYNHVAGDNEFSLHAMQHSDVSSWVNADANAQFERIVGWHMEKLAFLLSELKRDSGTEAGSLLDHSVVVACSEFVNGLMHWFDYLPVIVAGQAQPMETGRHVAYASTEPSAPSWSAALPGEQNRCMNDLWQTALQAVGALTPSEKMGDTSRWEPEPLSDLWRL